jgi:hypothetical protein
MANLLQFTVDLHSSENSWKQLGCYENMEEILKHVAKNKAVPLEDPAYLGLGYSRNVVFHGCDRRMSDKDGRTP